MSGNYHLIIDGKVRLRNLEHIDAQIEKQSALNRLKGEKGEHRVEIVKTISKSYIPMVKHMDMEESE